MEMHIGIEKKERGEITKGLSSLLADSYSLYLMTQNFHWNITGPLFDSLHELFEKQYQDLAEAVDEIAERIRALGYPAPATFKKFSALSTIEEVEGIPPTSQMIEALVRGNEATLRTARALIKTAEASSDQPTLDLLARRMLVHEKNAWMLRSHLEGSGEEMNRMSKSAS